MTLAVLLLATLITQGSRWAALSLPTARGAMGQVVDRVPVPLFAALAVVSLTGSDGRLTIDPPLVAACAGALLTVRQRSLLLTLAAGLAGYGAATLVL
jgi:branched-subunit amino acid transport protein